MLLYYLILWNQVDILQIHFTKDHVHMHLWTRFYSMYADGNERINAHSTSAVVE